MGVCTPTTHSHILSVWIPTQFLMVSVFPFLSVCLLCLTVSLTLTLCVLSSCRIPLALSVCNLFSLTPPHHTQQLIQEISLPLAHMYVQTPHTVCDLSPDWQLSLSFNQQQSRIAFLDLSFNSSHLHRVASWHGSWSESLDLGSEPVPAPEMSLGWEQLPLCFELHVIFKKEVIQ